MNENQSYTERVKWERVRRRQPILRPCGPGGVGDSGHAAEAAMVAVMCNKYYPAIISPIERIIHEFYVSFVIITWFCGTVIGSFMAIHLHTINRRKSELVLVSWFSHNRSIGLCVRIGGGVHQRWWRGPLATVGGRVNERMNELKWC